jgi:formylglycine-generating enzyme required for sulfatase activity
MKSLIILLAICMCSISSIAQSTDKKVVVTSPVPIDPPMVFVKGGTFVMGDSGGLRKERPAHSVTIRVGFVICKYEVTQRLWMQVMGSNPSRHKGCDDCPVENVTWRSIRQFLKRLNTLTGRHYRLPTEAEWEYAASGGEKSKGYTYSGSNDPAEVGWYKPNADNMTHPVGQKKPNELGLYDMCGNVWEICSDWYHPGYYKRSTAVNPKNTHPGLYRVVRGGSWRSGPERCYNKARNRNIMDHHISNGGFRLILDR